MAAKRKFGVDEDIRPHKQKQLKLLSFPQMNSDEDVLMCDAESVYPEFHHHCRLSSNVSSTSSSSSDSSSPNSPAYPTFNLYPMPFFTSTESVDTKLYAVDGLTVQRNGVAQPLHSFAHQSKSCTQVPKLRISCAPGLSGQRTMWCLCEQCGAIAMVGNY